jgi:magnesium chelatase subunit ChlD-like protein
MKGNASLRRDHFRFIRSRARGGVLHCFVLDCSGSMLAQGRLALAKGLLVGLFHRAYRARHDVALICFGGDDAHVRFEGAPRWWNEQWVQPIGGGGGTPLSLGIAQAAHSVARSARRKPAQQRWLWILSDGRSAEQPSRPQGIDHAVIVDFEADAVRLGRCGTLARAWDAVYCTAAELIGE